MSWVFRAVGLLVQTPTDGESFRLQSAALQKFVSASSYFCGFVWEGSWPSDDRPGLRNACATLGIVCIFLFFFCSVLKARDAPVDSGVGGGAWVLDE